MARLDNPPARRVSIVTPTFNRAHTLRDVFDSLRAQQTVFEWIVADDGSTDGTASLIDDFAAQSAFPVRYLRQDHAGKHEAVNRGVAIAQAPLIGLLDSDDALFPGALDRLVEYWDALPDQKRFVGVTGLDVDHDGNVMGTKFPADVVDVSWQDMVYRHHITGDKWGILRADLLRAHPFKANKGYVFEGGVWRVIGREYLTRYVNVPVLSVRTSGDDRLSIRPFAAIAHGALVQNTLVLNEDFGWFRHHPTGFVKSAANLVRAALHTGEGVGAQFSAVRGLGPRSLLAASAPLGWFLYRRDLRRAARGPRRQ